MTDDGWSPWIQHDGGECPIPWAKAGEYGLQFRDDTGEPIRVEVFDVDALYWSGGCWDQWKHQSGYCWNIIAYRYRLDAAPPGWTPPGSPPPYTAPRGDLAAMQPQTIAPATPSVIEEIAAERRRQIEVEGWTAEHDDRWNDTRQLARAAASYAGHAGNSDRRREDTELPLSWPWPPHSWKPKDPRRDLVRAAALLVAAVEQMDRQAAKEKTDAR